MYLFQKLTSELLFRWALRLNSFFSLLAILLIFLFLCKESFEALSINAGGFLFDKSWYPLENQFNLVPMLIGSLLVTFGSVILALPIAIMVSVFVQFYAPLKLKTIFIKSIELYSGIPSVIFGFWGLMKIVPLINNYHPPGQSLLAGICILTLMIFPIISLNLISGISTAPHKVYVISQSLGLRKSKYIWFVLIPYLKAQIISSTLLATGRAIGETMAVVMVCGNIVQIPGSVLEPIRTLTANIALEMAYAMGHHRSALFLTGLLLLLIVCLLFALSTRLQRGLQWNH